MATAFGAVYRNLNKVAILWEDQRHCVPYGTALKPSALKIRVRARVSA